MPGPDWDKSPLGLVEAHEIVGRGMAANRVNSFETIGFSTRLVPGPASDTKTAGATSVSLVQTGRLLLHIDKPGTFTFDVEGNVIYSNRGPVKLRLFADANEIVDESVATAEVFADKKLHTVTLTTKFAGLHYLEYADGGAVTRISWPKGQRVVVPIGPDVSARVLSNYKYDGVFYVPKGTRIIGGYAATATGKILRPDGTEAVDLKTHAAKSYFALPVPAGSDGAYWQVKGTMRGFLLLTVPPYVGRSLAEMLVPMESLQK